MSDYTEEEAAEKWCPFVRNTYTSDAPSGYAPPHNRFGGGAEHEERNCIGSKCMAWRWTFPEQPSSCNDPSERCGRCGLAG